MKETDRAILNEFAASVREIEPAAQIWAFGSPRGDAQPDSDLNVCVVLPEVTVAGEDGVRRCAWEVAFRHGRVIPAIVLSEIEFEDGPMSASTLVSNIRREGIAA